MSVSWKVGQIRGIDVYVHPTFLLLLALVGMGEGGALAVLLMASAFGCVLLHELGHALTARFCGIRTLDITLYPIGGVARLARIPRKPGAELLITLAGPAVNLALAALFLMLSGVLNWLDGGDGTTSLAALFLSTLATINLFLGLFNLIPAFPMDGGRVLRAALSGWLGRGRATEIAAGLGRTLAVAYGAWSLLTGHWVQVLLAAFVYFAAGAELVGVRRDEDDRSSQDGDGGVWIAPPGQRWVRAGRGVWQLAPIPVHGGSRGTMPWR